MSKTKTMMHGLRKDEVWSCRFLLVVCFAVLLPIAIIARLSGGRWRPWPSSTDGYRSPITEAKLMSETIAGTVYSI